MNAQLRSDPSSIDADDVFLRVGVHAGLTEEDIQLAIEQAKDRAAKSAAPVFTVFFDELNTASCLAALKSVMVDGRLVGRELGHNFFFVGATNPLRLRPALTSSSAASSMSGLETKTSDKSRAAQPYDETHDATYQVRDLPATLKLLRFQFAAAGAKQLRAYVAIQLMQVLAHRTCRWLTLVSCCSSSKSLRKVALASRRGLTL